MKVIVREMNNGLFSMRELDVKDEELIKKLLDLFFDSDIGDTEYFIYEEVKKYYQLDYYYKEGFKRINFIPEHLPEERYFLNTFL